MDNIQQQINKIRKLQIKFKELWSPLNYRFGELQFPKWYSFHKDSEVIIKSIFGEGSQRFSEWKDLVIPEDPDIEDTEGFFSYENEQRILKIKMKKQLELMLKDIKEKNKSTNMKSKNKIFIVHGTDHEPVKDLKVILENAGLQALILEDLPSGSQTIIEKLETYSDVDYAFVVLSPDDEACSKGIINQLLEAKDKVIRFKPDIAKNTIIIGDQKVDELTREIHARARQNVILEFGYFIGKLGRKKVCYLLKGSVEIPSDMNGIAYIPFNDSITEVKQKIINELVEAEII